MANAKVVRLTIPVTSPVPVVVAVAPILRVKELISKAPFVAEALALAKLSTPFTVISPAATLALVPLPLIPKLL